MIATVLSDIALNLGAFAAVIAAITALLASRRGRRIEAKVGAVGLTVDGIDHAVNRQPRHAPTIPERLDVLEAMVERVTDDVLDLHARFDAAHVPPSSQGGQT